MLLLDEIEKAHPDIFNLLLQVMDHATLTDNNGRKADFRNVVLILTTNAGAQEMSARRVGFGQDQSEPGNARDAIERTFSPEFRNRLDAWVAFDSLPARGDPARWWTSWCGAGGAAARRRRSASSSPARRARWLAEHGFDRKIGARPMARLIQNEVKKPLAERILFGDLQGGGTVTVVRWSRTARSSGCWSPPTRRRSRSRCRSPSRPERRKPPRAVEGAPPESPRRLTARR